MSRNAPFSIIRSFNSRRLQWTSNSCLGRIGSSTRQLSIWTKPTLKTREFPHFTPSYPNYFSPSRYWNSTIRFTSPRNSLSTSTATVSEGTGEVRQLPTKGVYRWLFLCSGLTLGVIVVGGVTRLTESGLSITEWKPVTGILPPLSRQDWEEEFSKYKATPEFKMLNSSMTLPEFKSIFYMEWGHRVLGRTIGLAFTLPYIYFLSRRVLPISLSLKLGSLGLLLGFQGALGWYMVKSGLDHGILERNDVPRVSQYRLASHLGAALVFFMGCLRLGLGVKKDLQWANGGNVNGMGEGFLEVLKRPGVRAFKGASMVVLLLTFITAMSGAFVAGLDAGLVYNEFPYMGNRLIPPKDELFDSKYDKPSDGKGPTGSWRNLFENPVTVQFDHRLFAMAIYTTTGLLYGLSLAPSLKPLLPPLTRHLAAASFGMVNIQALLGITTLLYLVPIPLAATHQAGSVVLLTTLLALVTTFRRPSALASKLRALRVGKKL